MIRQAILETWGAGSATDRLLKLLDDDPAEYFRFIAKVLPMQVMDVTDEHRALCVEEKADRLKNLYGWHEQGNNGSNGNGHAADKPV